MVEADYRMKLIGIGLEQPPVRLASYVDRANPAQVARNALQRWYFVPDYQCVRVSDDELAMELVGDGVKLVGEDEVVAKDGSRARAGGAATAASQAFVNAFTKVYPEAGRAVAGLRRAAQLHRHGRRRGLHPEAGLLRPGEVEAGSVPRAKRPIRSRRSTRRKQVESAVNAIWKGNDADDADRRRRADAADRGGQPDQSAAKTKRPRCKKPARRASSRSCADQWWWD